MWISEEKRRNRRIVTRKKAEFAYYENSMHAIGVIVIFIWALTFYMKLHHDEKTMMENSPQLLEGFFL